MSIENNSSKEAKPMGFGKTMLASALGMLIATAVINIITFISFIVFFISSFSSSFEEKEPIVGDNFAVELNLTGMVSECAGSNLQTLFSEVKSTSIEQLRTAIDHAAEDSRVHALYLHLGGSNLGWAQAEELSFNLEQFRKAAPDKPIIAYGESMSQPEYYLATCANTIAVHPSGAIDFRGMGAEMMFYKGLLDKLGVHMELIRPTSCAYKSAGEVYTRTDMSDANREQVRSYISSIWSYAAQNIAKRRNITVDQVNTIADELSAYLPQDALTNKIVDTLCFAQDIKNILKERYAAKKIVSANRYAEDVQVKAKDNKIAVIYAEGDVVPGSSNGAQTAVYGDDIAKALFDAAKDKKVKAIVLRVNSPGGAVTASETMTSAVMAAKKQKPVIVSMSGLAASAGYEISCNANCIVAHPTTLTGSIGVFATIPEVGTLLRQRLGITTDTVMTNKNSTGLSLYRPLSPSARAMLQKNVEDFYITFTQRVADGRHKSREYIDSIARGRVWTGLQAKEIGLVDTLGGMSLALQIAAEKASVDLAKCSIVNYPSKKDFWSQLIELSGKQKDEEELRARLNTLVPFYNDLEKWATMEPVQARLPFALSID